MVRRLADHMPLHRLQKIYAREGVDIAKSTMCGWQKTMAELCKPLVGARCGKTRSLPRRTFARTRPPQRSQAEVLLGGDHRVLPVAVVRVGELERPGLERLVVDVLPMAMCSVRSQAGMSNSMKRPLPWLFLSARLQAGNWDAAPEFSDSAEAVARAVSGSRLPILLAAVYAAASPILT